MNQMRITEMMNAMLRSSSRKDCSAIYVRTCCGRMILTVRYSPRSAAPETTPNATMSHDDQKLVRSTP